MVVAAAHVSARSTPHVAPDVVIGCGRRLSAPSSTSSGSHWRAPSLRMPFIDLLADTCRRCPAADLSASLPWT
ncbi:hypothetical protein BT67DRAFT_151036 [Trichocladium antarcticum]|uniref:Uncharacterized protein n=1 Tax=Trichocladium antarcticum TaxID=1450529 RepID=A0AAN6UF17_9PEZI|nr:hypothetical protein BT67DRAFT_151036 [Trichocladium antarcticum]